MLISLLKNRVLPALAITCSQIIYVFAATERPTLAEGLSWLNRWDSVWYQAIIDHGYTQSLPANSSHFGAQTIAWFPGYPVVASFFKSLFYLESSNALLFSAIFFALLFWTFVLVFLSKTLLSETSKALTVLLILSHPSSFYLISGYSESTFITCILGYCLFMRSEFTKLKILSPIFGFYATFTRVVGIPIAGFSLLLSFKSALKGKWRFSLLNFLSFFLIISGAGLFLYYLHSHFGKWDLYFDIQKSNWSIQPSFLALLKMKTYSFCGSYWDSNCLSQNSVPITFILLILSSTVLIFSRHSQAQSLVFSAWVILIISVAGLATRGNVSLIRYSLPTYILCLLSLTLCIKRSLFYFFIESKKVKNLVYIVLIWIILFQFSIQNILIRRYINTIWVS